MCRRICLVFFLSILLIHQGCATDSALTSEERSRQQAADYAVATILFENDLGGNASYNVHKDGAVVIKFDESVSFVDYNLVVNEMRANPSISSVRAMQSGREVCPLR
jgi:hypothetical protein